MRFCILCWFRYSFIFDTGLSVWCSLCPLVTHYLPMSCCGDVKGGSQDFLPIVIPSTNFMRHLYHSFNHLFWLLYWPTMHAEHLPYHSRNHYINIIDGFAMSVLFMLVLI
jgi:hypothetical protein